MPFEYDWRRSDRRVGEEAADQKLDELRTILKYANILKRCAVCPTNYNGHSMRYKIWYCASSACRSTRSSCPYWLKVHECLEKGVHEFYEHGEHTSAVGSPTDRPFTRVMKFKARAMIENAMPPARIRNALIDQIGLTKDTVPSLKTIQNFVYNYKKSILFHSDIVDDVILLAGNAQYSADLEESTAFTFGYQLDQDGNPLLETGSDDNPFVLAFSTKALLRKLDRDPESFVFHMDATFKVTKRGFPVFVCGISDATRSFHVVALFIVSQRTEMQYSAALTAISDTFLAVVGHRFQMKYFMADAEDAQFNAFNRVVVATMEASYLMCFFHVVKNVRDRLKGMSEFSVHLAFRHIYQMHYAHNQDEFTTLKESAMIAWSARDDLQEFMVYFDEQWLSSRYNKWQCFHSPCGFAKTNNPAETFNKLIKRDYSLRVRLKVGEMTTKILLLCKHQSITCPDFQLKAQPSEKLVLRTKKIFKTPLLRVSERHNEIGFMLGGITTSEDIIMAHSYRSADDQAGAKDQGEVNKRRMERWGQPTNGWEVNITHRTCQCRAFFKYAHCVHLLAAMRKRAIAIKGWKNPARRFVDRRVILTSTAGSGARKRSSEGRGGRGRGGRGGQGAVAGGLRARGGRGREHRSGQVAVANTGTSGQVGRPRTISHALSRD